MKEIIERMHDLHALVVGDAIVDNYVFGRVERVCPESPLPVFIPEREEQRNGGALHVVDQLRALEVLTMGMHGHPYSLKTRFMVGHQMVGLRIDDDAENNITSEQAIKALAESVLGENKCDVIILSDYNKGFLQPEMCQYVIKFANDNGIPTVVDPKGADWSKYEGATWVCPNQREVYEAKGHRWAGDMLIKRGERGLLLTTEKESVDFPAVARHVYDVTGAGDTVVAVFAAALAAKATPTEAAQLANIAAGWTVGEVGTVYITKEKLLELV